MTHQWKRVSGVLGAMIVGALVTGVALTVPDFLRGDPYAQEIAGGGALGELAAERSAQPAQRLPEQNLAAAQDLSTAFRNVANLMRPSVVSINTKATQVVRQRVPRGFEMFGRPQQQRRESEGMGSGVVVRADGYILTNNHVVEGTDELTVEFSDGRTAPGRIIGTDPQTDLAVIKVERTGLQAVPMGNSDAIQVGDWVVAIGSPFGLDQTVTAGIISGKNRVRGIVGDGEGFEDFLQTDAAINPGNSGGPLVNLRGELVGINTAIMSRSGSSAGIGFAIPVGLASPVANSIIKNGTVRRGFLGASLAPVNETTIDAFDLKVKSGVLIESVLERMPAAESGVQPGDVVVSIDGREMKTSALMRNYVASRPPGAKMLMEINRDGKRIPVRVDLKERTEEVMAQFGSGEVMGAELVPVTPASAQKYGYTNLKAGLIVTSIRDESTAQEGGLEVGDVIESAAGRQLGSAKDLDLILQSAAQRGQTVRLGIRRGDQLMLMVVRQ